MKPTRRILRWVLVWALLAGLYVALADTVKLQELVAGAIIATAGTLLAAAITDRDRHRRPGPAPGAATIARQLGEPLLRLPVDTARLGAALLGSLLRRRPLAGRFRTVPLEGDPLLAEWWGSLAPARYVIAVDERARAVHRHELLPAEDRD